MSDEDDADSLLADALDDREQPLGVRTRHRSGRLVEHEQLGCASQVTQGTCYRYTGALAR